jgi:TonB-dependent SusC/RagA subfamily outer membrane receptor
MIPLSARAVLSVSIIAALGSCASGAPRGHSAAVPVRADSNRIADDPVARLIQSKSPGLLVTRATDGEIAVEVMQGRNSFYGDTRPLYLLDDIPFRPGAGGALTGINPYDIESITLLRRPEDTALYGVRGANGVIVIRTKKPGKEH